MGSDKQHYFNTSYLSPERFVSFGHQIQMILDLCPATVLEIGVGPGILSGTLSKSSISVVTVDVLPDLLPDVVGSATLLPFPKNGFDVVACFQVLEHLRFDDAEAALGEIKRVTRRQAIISVPNVQSFYSLDCTLPFLGRIVGSISLPRFPKPRSHNMHSHKWELGRKDYPVSRFRDALDGAGLRVIEDFRLFGNPFHHFFSVSPCSPS